MLCLKLWLTYNLIDALTGTNLAGIKNCIGAFYQPSLVLCDYGTLSTLPQDILADGCAEVIKYSIINDKALFEKLHLPIMGQIEDVIYSCVKNKRDIVDQDERDTGVRQLLNLGHTAAHSIEKLSNFAISHGSAVAIGTAIITRAAAAKGLCPQSDCDKVISLINSFSLPTSSPYSPDELARIALSDKKRSGREINLIVPFAIGDSRIYPVDVNTLADFFAYGV